MSKSLLMIPGPVEVAPEVLEAFCVAPPSHVAPNVIESFGKCLESMRHVWKADATSQPFIVSGSGTTAMEMAVTNLVDPDDPVVVVGTGYFSDRMADMLRRRGARVATVDAPIGQVPNPDDIRKSVDTRMPKVVFATHVDTSTGVRIDPKIVCEIADRVDALTVFDGVCSTAAERFEMAEWGADIFLTASQKAIGLPPGLALLVASNRALRVREAIEHAPPKSLDFEEWLPIMRAYESRAPSYFATPATNLILALEVALDGVLAYGIDATVERHEAAASALRSAWSHLEIELVPEEGLAANTLSALRYPKGHDASILKAMHNRGVVVAGGLHPDIKDAYFRVGHMGYTVERIDWLEKTVRALGQSLGRSEDVVESALEPLKELE